jgi:hypothetical protein
VKELNNDVLRSYLLYRLLIIEKSQPLTIATASDNVSVDYGQPSKKGRDIFGSLCLLIKYGVPEQMTELKLL